MSQESTSVLSTAGQEAGALAADAADQARDLWQDARQQLADVTIQERDRLGDFLESFTGELQGMRAAGTGGYATQMVDAVLMKARALQESVRETEPEEMVAGVQRYARMKPGMFLGGALVLGFTVGRVTRTMAKAASGSAGPVTQSRAEDRSADGY